MIGVTGHLFALLSYTGPRNNIGSHDDENWVAFFIANGLKNIHLLMATE
jgi:hypothetical protein